MRDPLKGIVGLLYGELWRSFKGNYAVPLTGIKVYFKRSSL